MANNFVGHVDKWLLLSESETDFAILFVRAWIPFNAWYCNNYQNTNDRHCIDLIKTDQNQFRAKLVALLGGNYPEALLFKGHLANLHNLLEQNPIPEIGDNRITFKSLWFRNNPVTVTNPLVRRRSLEYKVEKLSSGQVVAIIVNTRTNPPLTLYNYTHTRYDIAHFETDIIANIPTLEKREAIFDCFKALNPKKKENLLAAQKKNSIEIGNTYFINDAGLLSQAIIELLYSLRCKLFHGELQPSLNNLTIYEPCYYILRILLKSLK